MLVPATTTHLYRDKQYTVQQCIDTKEPAATVLSIVADVKAISSILLYNIPIRA